MSDKLSITGHRQTQVETDANSKLIDAPKVKLDSKKNREKTYPTIWKEKGANRC